MVIIVTVAVELYGSIPHLVMQVQLFFFLYKSINQSINKCIKRYYTITEKKQQSDGGARHQEMVAWFCAYFN